MGFITTNHLINSKQHSLMKKKARATNLLETLDLKTKFNGLKIPVVIVFIDFLKAYHLVAHKRLISTLSCKEMNIIFIFEPLSLCKRLLKT
jgi:hypothetical protein